MTAAHITPGPWFVTHDAAYPGELAINTVIDGTTYHIALVHGGNPPGDQSMVANANLIAAAPELLKHAKAMLAALGGNVPDWLRDEAAALESVIAQAEDWQ